LAFPLSGLKKFRQHIDHDAQDIRRHIAIGKPLKVN
jgi:hypothetical protein